MAGFTKELNSSTANTDITGKLARLLNQHRLERGLGELNADSTALRPYWILAHQRAHEAHLSNQDAASGAGLAKELSNFGLSFRAVQELRVAGAKDADAALQRILGDERLEGQLLGQSAGAVAVGYCGEANIFDVLLFEPVNTAQVGLTANGHALALTEVRLNGTRYRTDGDGLFDVTQPLPYGSYPITAACAAAGELVVGAGSDSKRQTFSVEMKTPKLSVRVALGGVPVVQRAVALYDAAGRLVGTQTTDTEGTVSFEGLEKNDPQVLPGEEVRVAIADPLFDPVGERVVLCADANLTLEVELRPVRGLRLDVFTHSRAGPEDVPVVLRDETGVVVFNQTAQNGTVAFECSSAEGLLATGRRYVLRVEGTAFQLAEQRFVYVENQSVTLFLEPAGAFSVQLLDGGLPRPGLLVALRRGVTEVAACVTDAAGVARFEGSRWDLELGALYAVLVDGTEAG